MITDVLALSGLFAVYSNSILLVVNLERVFLPGFFGLKLCEHPDLETVMLARAVTYDPSEPRIVSGVVVVDSFGIKKPVLSPV